MLVITILEQNIDDYQTFCGSPLYCKMVAETFENATERRNLVKCHVFTTPKTEFNLVKLYEKFWYIMFDRISVVDYQ